MMPVADYREHSQALAKIIQLRRSRALDRQDLLSLLLRLLLLALVFYLIFTQVFLISQVRGNSMFPSLKDGDLVLGFRLQGEYLKGDLVLYSLEDGRHVGRIAAGPGDYVDISPEGELLVNGTLQTGEILYPTYPGDKLTYPYHVPEDSLFILGDYRTQSSDSRDFGALPLEDVEAKVISLLRRRGL